MSEPQDDPWRAIKTELAAAQKALGKACNDGGRIHMTIPARQDDTDIVIGDALRSARRFVEDRAAVEARHAEELTTLRAQLAAGRQEIEAALKQLMADAFAAKLTATDAADVAYVAGLQKGIDIIAALASPSTPEPQTCDTNRCAVCGWPLADSDERGCVRGNCSQRPLPEAFYDAERARAESLALSPDQPTEAQ